MLALNKVKKKKTTQNKKHDLKSKKYKFKV